MSDDTTKPNPPDLLARLRERCGTIDAETYRQRVAAENTKWEAEHTDELAVAEFAYIAAKARFSKMDSNVPPNVPRIFPERIARLIHEVEEYAGCHENSRGSGRIYALCYQEELMTRVCDLVEWVVEHANYTFICLSDDPSDVHCYAIPWGYWRIYDHFEFDQGTDCEYDLTHPGFWLRHSCSGDVSKFNDNTLWEVAANIDGTDRYYLAFANEPDAMQFRLRWL